MTEVWKYMDFSNSSADRLQILSTIEKLLDIKSRVNLTYSLASWSQILRLCLPNRTKLRKSSLIVPILILVVC